MYLLPILAPRRVAVRSQFGKFQVPVSHKRLTLTVLPCSPATVPQGIEATLKRKNASATVATANAARSASGEECVIRIVKRHHLADIEPKESQYGLMPLRALELDARTAGARVAGRMLSRDFYVGSYSWAVPGFDEACAHSVPHRICRWPMSRIRGQEIFMKNVIAQQDHLLLEMCRRVGTKIVIDLATQL